MFLVDWLGQQAALIFEEALQDIARSSRAPTSLYSIRLVLKCWASMCVASEASTPSSNSTVFEIQRDLSALRLQYFTQRDASGIALATIVTEWRCFLKLLRAVMRKKGLPRIDEKSQSVIAPNGRLFDIARDRLTSKHIEQNLAPRSYRFDLDSYNDELFEALSIGASDVDALEDFECRLGHAISTIYQAAFSEFEDLENCRETGKTLLEQVDYDQLQSFPNDIDPRYDCNAFLEPEGHPDVLANVLSIVFHEMGGIPKPWGHSRTYAGERPSHVKANYCKYVIVFGKNRLLPYLGLLTSKAAISCILLLMMEHPNLNASTVLNLEVDGETADLLNISSIGEKSKYLSALKLRAGKMVGGTLTPVSERVLARVVEWTQPLRRQLALDGNVEMAKRLWIGMSARDYHITAFSSSTLTVQIGSGAEKFNNPKEAYPLTSFQQRHPEIGPWAKRLNLKALRKNVGVLDFLRSNGDLVQLAKLLGHKSVRTTIKSYIPNALRLAMYERQIRRHQNILIAASFGNAKESLPHTDFGSIEELHKFLCSVFPIAPQNDPRGLESGIREALEEYLGRGDKKTIPANAPDANARLILGSDPVPLSVAFQYADHLETASNSFLDKPDVVTNIPPRFWRDFARSLNSPLPNAMFELQQLVGKAQQIASQNTMKIRFPNNG